MKSEVLVNLSVADQVWVATALLHQENPKSADFPKRAILQRAHEEYAEGARRPGISQHISTHCIASKAPSPAKHRMLTRTGRGRRRLFRSGDPFHPARANGNVTPQREELPEKYHELLVWYATVYDRQVKPAGASAKSRGATAEALMNLMGRISREDADEMIHIINDCCGRVDANEW